MKLFEACVYAILEDDALLRVDNGAQPSSPLSEGKPWSKVAQWLTKAAARKERVAIVFADAKHVHRWLGWAVLTDIKVDPVGESQRRTTYRYECLRPLLDHARSEFLLLEEGRPLPDSHIRSYVHFRTPAFLQRAAEEPGVPLLVDWLRSTDAVERALSSNFDDDNRSAGEWTLNRALYFAQELKPGSWSAVLTPGRIRIRAGDEEVMDVGEVPYECAFSYDPEPGQSTEGDDELSFKDLFQKYEVQFKRRLARLSAIPQANARHSEVVVEYLRARMVGDGVGGEGRDRRMDRRAPRIVLPLADPRSEVEENVEPFDPTDERDGCLRVLSNLVRRQGQGSFRRDLLQAYEGRCAITGWAVESVLEAAHIMPYRGEHTNHVSNGVLLRSDLHLLFDLGLLRIDPDRGDVVIDETLRDTPYFEFHGTKLFVPQNLAHRPHRECLERRFGYRFVSEKPEPPLAPK